jgi:MYXO-CTERM domain-containing protein
VYSIAVPVGQEEAMAAAYAADPVVYAAAVDRETIGYLTPPDTAMAPPTPGWPLVAGALLVVLAGGLALMRTRRR